MGKLSIDGGIDGGSLSKSVALVLDRIKYRKYAKAGYTTVVWINKENTMVKLLDGYVHDNTLNIPSQDETKMLDKVYILPSKKLVVRLCFVKEDINTTLDLTVTDTSKISADLFKRFVNIKILDDLQSFNLGQMMLGGALGFVAGFVATMMLIMLYGVLL